jgi:predicted MPP superfamily phosphohydrolase
MAVTRRTVLRGLFATGLGAAAGTGAYGFLYGRYELGLTKQIVPVMGLAPALAGLRIGLITDIHRSPWVSHADVSRAVNLLMSASPDLIVLGGDYVTWGDRQYIEPSADALAPLTAPLGVFAILGNHDDDHFVPAALTARRIQVLKDARTRVMVKGEALDLVGIRFWTRRAADIASLLRGAVAHAILLAHDPRRLNEAAALGVPLVLSGHTHGGQVVLPILGPIAAQKFPVVSGLGRRGSTTMFVSRGLGTVYVPARINCPPEVAILTLQPRPDQEAAAS